MLRRRATAGPLKIGVTYQRMGLLQASHGTSKSLFSNFSLRFHSSGKKSMQTNVRESLCWEMDAMNREVDDVRARVLELSHLSDDPRNHFYSLQPAYVRASTDIAKMKKMLVVTSLFGPAAVAGVVAAYKWF